MSNSRAYTTDGKVTHYSRDEEINVTLGNLIGEKFRAYRTLWDQANRFEVVTDFPLFLQVDMNQRCNYRCPHCIVGTPERIPEYYGPEELHFADFKRIVDEGAQYGCPSISPQGSNEPLLIKNIEDWIRYAHDRGFIDIMMNTNASALTETRARRLLDSGITRLRFSLDAVTPETYATVRVGSQPLDQVVGNIERFLELKEKGGYKLPVTGVSFCRMAINEHEAEAFMAYWADKVDIVSFQTFVPPVDVGDYTRFYASDQRQHGAPENFMCPQPFQRVVIRNYDITPCCVVFSSRLKIGDLRHDTIHKAWHSPLMNELRALHRKGQYARNPVCHKCVGLIYPSAPTDGAGA